MGKQNKYRNPFFPTPPFFLGSTSPPNSNAGGWEMGVAVSSCFFLMFFAYSSMRSHPWDMVLHELLHGYFPQERFQHRSLPQHAVLQEQNSLGHCNSWQQNLLLANTFLHIPAGILLQHWLSKGCSSRMVICFAVDLQGTVFIMGCRGISAPLSESPPPSPSPWTLVSAECFSHIIPTLLSHLLLHRTLCPYCLNKKTCIFYNSSKCPLLCFHLS